MSPQNIIADRIRRPLDGHEQIQTVRALLCLIPDRLWFLSVSDPEYTKPGDTRFNPIRNFHDREAQIPDADSLFPHDKIMRQVGLRFGFIFDHKICISIQRAFQFPSCHMLLFLNITRLCLRPLNFPR